MPPVIHNTKYVIRKLIRKLAIAILPGLIVAGLVFSANTYYDLDLGKVIIEEITKIVGQLETTATTTLATVSGYVGVGTNSPSSLLEIYSTDDTKLTLTAASSTDPYIVLRTGSTPVARALIGVDQSDSEKLKLVRGSDIATSTGITIDASGYVGIGTTSPDVALHVGVSSPVSITEPDGSLFVSKDLEVGETTYVGSMEFPENSGVVSWIDMPVTASASAGTPESYTARIDGTNILTVYSESDGAGSIQNYAVGIATTTPEALLSIGIVSGRDYLIAGDTTTPEFIIKNTGNIGIGTSSPSYKLTVSGDLYVSATSTLGSSTSTPTILTGYIQSDIIPYSDLTYNLGSSSFRWANLYAGTTTIGSTITIGSHTFEGSATTTLFTTGNSNQLVLGTNGNVGIGTATPGAGLEIVYSDRLPLKINKDSAGGDVAEFWNNNNFLRFTVSQISGGETQLLNFRSGGDYQPLSVKCRDFRIKTGTWSGGNTERVRVDENGNVGIGTTTPSSLLELYKTDETKLTITSASSTDALIAFRTGSSPSTQALIGIDQSDSNKLKLVRGSDIATSTGITIDSSGNVGIGTATPRTKLELNNDGAILAIGTYGSGWTEPSLGAGTRLLWYPRKAAFRVGYVSGTQWDNANIGVYSTAIGYNTKASGGYSIAMGFDTTASKDWSTAMGRDTTASGYYSTAMGYYTTASESYSTAMGGNTTASGYYSTAIGRYTKAEAYADVAVGSYNVGGGSGTSWVSTDPIFEIGIGTSDTDRANALTVLKNGNVGISTTTPSAKLHIVGDINVTGTTTFNGVSYSWPSSDGTSGQVLTTDGSGTLSWTSAAGGVSGSGSAGQVTFWTDSDTISGDNDFYWDNTNNRLGIGTTTPSYKLTVSGDLYVSATSTLGSSTSTPTILTGYIQSDIIPYSDLTYNLGSSSFRWANLYAGTTTIGSTITIGSHTFEGSATTTLFTTGNSNQLVLGANGNVGIGTVTPASLLELYNTDETKLTITSASSTDALIAFRTGSSPSTQALIGIDQSDSNKLKLVRGSDIATSTGITIDSSGNVGIGTTEPTEELEVFGDILASGNLALGGASIDAYRGINYSSIASAADVYGIYSNLTVDTNLKRAYGVYNSITLDGLGAVGYGVHNSINASNGAAKGYGIWNIMNATGSGAFTVGLFNRLSTSDNTTNESITGVWTHLTTYASDDVGFGVKVQDYSDSTGGTQYGLYVDLDDPDVTNYSIYIEDGSGISYFGSNVGIGTTTPSSLLELYNTDETKLTITSASSTDALIAFRTGSSPSTQALIGIDQSDSNKLKLVRGSDIATSTGITIDSSGNVGIGTTTPAYTLDVAGTIRATKSITSFSI